MIIGAGTLGEWRCRRSPMVTGPDMPRSYHGTGIKKPRLVKPGPVVQSWCRMLAGDCQPHDVGE